MTRDAPTAAGIGTGPRGPRTEPVWREETHRTRPLHRQRSTYHSRSFCVPIHDPRPIGPTLPPHIPIRSYPGDAVPVSAATRGTDPSRPFKEITPSSSPDNCPAYPPPQIPLHTAAVLDSLCVDPDPAMPIERPLRAPPPRNPHQAHSTTTQRTHVRCVRLEANTGIRGAPRAQSPLFGGRGRAPLAPSPAHTRCIKTSTIYTSRVCHNFVHMRCICARCALIGDGAPHAPTP